MGNEIWNKASVEGGCYVYLTDLTDNYLKVLDSRHISERKEISRLRNDFCSERNKFTEIENQFLSNSSNRMTIEELFFAHKQNSNLLIGISNSGFKFIKLNSLKDYLITFLWIVATDQKDSKLYMEYSEILILFVKVFGIEYFTENLLFLYSLQNFNQHSFSFCVEWMKLLLTSWGSVISVKQKQILQKIEDDEDKFELKFSNIDFLEIKNLIISLLKIFGGFDCMSQSSILNAVLQSIYKWKMSNRLEVSSMAVVPSSAHVNRRGWISGSLNINLIKIFAFDVENIFHRVMIIEEKTSSSGSRIKLLNKDNQKLRSRAKGVLRYLLGSKRETNEGRNQLNQYINKHFTDNCISSDFRKELSEYSYRLNIGIDEIKSLLEIIINYLSFLKNLKSQWINNHSTNFAIFLIRQIDRKEETIHHTISSNLEEFAKDNHLQDISRIEIFLKMFVNLLILDNISPKYLSDLITQLKDKTIGECLTNKSFDSFWRFICFEIGHKFFFDRNSIYNYFLEDSVMSALKHFDRTVIELKNLKFGKEKKIRYEMIEEKKKRSRTLDFKDRAQNEEAEDCIKLEKLIKECFNKAGVILDKIKVNQLMALGKIFTWRGKIKEAVYLMNLLGKKFEDLKEKERICKETQDRHNFTFSQEQQNNQENEMNYLITEKLNDIEAEIHDIKLFFISLILNVQKKRLKKQEPNIFQKMKNWISSNLNKIYKINSDEDKKADFDIFLENLSENQLEIFWKETLEMILNLNNEDLRIFILQTILSVGKSNSLMLIENSLKESDLMTLINKGLRLQGKSGVQNYFFLIDFFEKKRNPKMAVTLIMKLVQNDYLQDGDLHKTKIKSSMFKSISEKLLDPANDEYQNWKFEKEEIVNMYYVTLDQKISLLKRATFISKALPEHLNKRQILSKIKSQMNTFSFQDIISKELQDTLKKINYMISQKWNLKLKKPILEKFKSLIELIITKLSIGSFSGTYLLENLIQKLYLFNSFDYYLKNFKVDEVFLKNNHFENLNLGISHYGKSCTIKQSFLLNSYINFDIADEDSDQVIGSISLLEDGFMEKEFKNMLIKDKPDILANLVKGNLIFPYNIYPPFLSLITCFIYSESSLLRQIEIKKNNDEIFDNFKMIENNHILLSTNENSQKPSIKDHLQEKSDLLTEIQFQSANNSLLINLLQENMSERLREKGVCQEPLWFVEHLLQNLGHDENGIMIFKVFYQSFNNYLYSRNKEILRCNSPANTKFENRLKICLLKVVDYCLDCQNVNFEKYMICLNNEEKDKYRQLLMEFEDNIQEIGILLEKVLSCSSQKNLLEFSNHMYLQWAQDLSRQLKEYKLSNKRKKIK